MKCLNCGEYMTSTQKVCSKCGKYNNLICPKCKKVNLEGDAYCSECGTSLTEISDDIKETTIFLDQRPTKEELLEKKKAKDLELEMTNFASDLIIECEGNKFKAIKEFKEKFDVDNNVASKYISNAYNSIDGATDESNNEETDEEEMIIQEIVNRNGIYNTIASIKEVSDRFGYKLPEAKEKVERVTWKYKAQQAKESDTSYQSNFNNNNYNSTNSTSTNYKKPFKEQIEKTIIVSNDSRKKATSLVGRGIVGNAIIGPVGLLAAGSAKSKKTTTFQVIYNTGKQETVTVKNDSKKFKEYCRYLNN